MAQYIRERFNLPRFAALALLVHTLGSPQGTPLTTNLLLYLRCLLFLLCLRLYDDLNNAAIDAGLPGRSYTLPQNQKPLTRALLVLGLLSLASCFVGSAWQQEAVFCLLFFGLQALLYRTLHRYPVMRMLLPLFKYPFLVYLSGAVSIYPALLMYTAMLAFDAQQDKTHTLGKAAPYRALAASFGLLAMYASFHFLISAAALLACSTLFALGMRRAEYLMLLILFVLNLMHVYL